MIWIWRKKMNEEELRECFPSILVAIKNYQNRIKYLEEQGKLSEYKINRIKSTTLYDLNKVEEYINKKLL